MKRIAWLSPLPPERSGIARYSQLILSRLREWFDITLFANTPADCQLQREFPCHPIESLPEQYAGYDDVVYHLGNSAKYHDKIYRMAWRLPGTIVLHDFSIHECLLALARRDAEGRGYYEQAIRESCEGKAARQALERFRTGSFTEDDFLAVPLCQAIVKRSRRTVVHDSHALSQLQQFAHVVRIPHFTVCDVQPDQGRIQDLKRRLGIEDSRFVIGCLGDLNPNKRPDLLWRVTMNLVDAGYDPVLVFAGTVTARSREAIGEVRGSGYHDRLVVTDYLADEEFLAAVNMADLIVNLRYPTRGETSGTLALALAAGKPVVLSDLPQYVDLGDEVCCRIALTGEDSQDEQSLRHILIRMITEPSVREVYGRSARRWAEARSLDRIAEEYRAVLTGA